MRRLPVALLLALALPACGSTVGTTSGPQSLGGAAVPGAGTDGLGQAGAAGDDTSLGQAGPTAVTGGSSGSTVGGGAPAPGQPGAPGVGGAPAQSGGGATTSGGGTTSTGSGSAGAVGPGITADKIHLGIAYFPDAAAGNAALGAAGSNAGDQRDYYNAVIKDLNDRGGVLGRKVVPIYHEYRSGEPIDPQHEAACQRWTKDNKVFAILFRGRILQECALKAGVLITSGDGEAGPTYQRVPNLVDPSAVRLERLGQATVSGLHREKYFTPSPDWPTGKIGVITWQDPSYEYGVKQGYLPALQKLGLKAEVRYVVVSQQVGSAADSSSAVSSAVLAFRSAGIDHVLIQDGAAGVFGLGGLTLLFLNNAKSQNYFPRYGFNANNVPGFSIYPPDQQRGMLAVDFSDYMPNQDDGIAPNPARERCIAVLRKGGVSPSDQATYATAAGACDGIWFVETLLEKASQPTLQGVLQAAGSLGTSYKSPNVYGTRLDGSRRDGGDMARNARYDTGCSCMRYTTKPYVP